MIQRKGVMHMQRARKIGNGPVMDHDVGRLYKTAEKFNAVAAGL
jgi:hypothetical protein